MPGTLFLTVSQGVFWKKAHACWKCYDDILTYEGHLKVETLSLQEFKYYTGPQPITPLFPGPPAFWPAETCEPHERRHPQPRRPLRR